MLWMACGLICAGGRNSVGCEGCSAASDSSQGRQRDVCVIRWANRMGTHARVLGSHINSKCQHTARASRHASAAPHSLTSEISSRVLHRRSTSTSRFFSAVLFCVNRIGTIRIANSSLHQQEQEQRSPRGFSINSVRFSFPAAARGCGGYDRVTVNLRCLNLTTAPSRQ